MLYIAFNKLFYKNRKYPTIKIIMNIESYLYIDRKNKLKILPIFLTKGKMSERV